MGSRKVPLVNNEYYHVFNRGVDKRSIFLDKNDIKRFFRSIKEFNSVDPIGSLFKDEYRKNKFLRGLTSQTTQVKKKIQNEKLVDIVCYCLNPNHFHFLLKQVNNNGISEFMKRLGGGYTSYFNLKYERSGSLFQGTFKSAYISSDDLLIRMSVYINLNYKVHSLWGLTSQSSFEEYVEDISKNEEICEKGIILDQFKSKKEYKKFAEEAVKEIIKQRKEDEELDKILID